MSKAWMPILIIFILTLVVNHVSSQPVSPSLAYVYCRNDDYGNYTANSTFENNLKSVMSTLQDQASLVAFYNASAGKGSTYKVYGQYYCRRDVDPTFCSQCIKEAAMHALNCSNARAAVIWYQECTLRYKNESMYGVIEEQLVLQYYSLNNLTSMDSLEFSSLLNDTVGELIRTAAYGNGSIPYYATLEKPVSTLTTAYFLAQCSPDMTDAQCELCLLSSFSYTLTCCGEWPTFLYTFPPSCQVMYSTNGVFYFGNVSPPPPPSSPFLASPPSPLLAPSPPPPPSSSSMTTLPTPPSTNGASATIRSSGMLFGVVITIGLLHYMSKANP